MDFETLKSHLQELLKFVKPVAGLVKDFFQAVCTNLPELGAVVDVGKWLLIILVVICLFYRLINGD